MVALRNVQNSLARYTEFGQGVEFFKSLGYRTVQPPVRPSEVDELPRRAQELIASFHLIADHPERTSFGEAPGFRIYHVELNSDRLRRTNFRIILEPFYRHFPQGNNLFVFTRKETPYRELVFVSPRRTRDDADLQKIRLILRSMDVNPQDPYRTSLEVLSQIAISPNEPPNAIWQKHREAFDVERVTCKFFEEFRRIFDSFQRVLRRWSRDPRWAHDYALQLLSRIMFVYFIQRKGWLGEKPKFMRRFFQAYWENREEKDRFLQDWLSVLFFEAFNNKFQASRENYRRRFPEEIREALAMAPYLNGGLFTRNKLDRKHPASIPDELFRRLIYDFDRMKPGLFERYNFTIVESGALDQEVAVDPEMLGAIYESLVNITFEGLTEEDLRGTAGIFYTPRVEIDLMCRLALVDWLAKRLGEEYKSLLYEAIFAYDPEAKDRADEALARENLWPRLNELLRKVTVLDPACGSGSFLVGMLLVLDDLQARANRQLGEEETPYERRRRIIAQNLYGVDVMPWAVHVAELRLWLQLAVETEVHPAERKFRPLLPNLSFKVRPGDSLVPEVGGIPFGLHREHLDIPPHLKGRLTKLKGRKLRFYYGEERGNPERIKREISREELGLFREILRYKRDALKKDIKNLTKRIEAPQPEQMGIPEIEPREAKQINSHVEKWKAEREEKKAQLERIKKALEALKTPQDVPFVWDIAFVEIFEGEEKGFAIVIGNPPYVRQERIAPPEERPEDYGGEGSELWREMKREYKAKLQEAVAAAYPRFFRYKPGESGFRRLAGRSDYYVYFYLMGLSLLNPKGTFCFITSNSWLDVGFGKDLQEFLLKHSHVKMILDNQMKRSFAQSDVNTIIALLGPPDDRKASGLEKSARFVMFKVPFEEVLSPVVFEEIEEAKGILRRPEFRCIVKSQRELYEEGLEIPEKGKGLVARGKYVGNKWGGKYLRAPDIFFTILEKGKGKLVRLGDIAEVRFGIKTGANDFFYLEPTGQPAPEGLVHVRNGAGWTGLIEAEYLRPMLFSLKECPGIRIDPRNFRYLVFLCRRTKSELRQLRHIHALGYIEWGENQTTKSGDRLPNAPSLRGRQLWYALPEQRPVDFISNRFVGERFLFVQGSDDPVCDVFFVGYFDHYRVGPDPNIGLALLNSSSTVLVADVLGRKTYGIGVIYLYGPEVNSLLLLDPACLTPNHREGLLQAFEQMCQRPILSIFQELGLPKPNRDYSNIHPEDVSLEGVFPDRRALDEVVFEALGLTEEEQLAVYRAVVELVKARLVKARSV